MVVVTVLIFFDKIQKCCEGIYLSKTSNARTILYLGQLFVIIVINVTIYQY